MSIEFHVGAQVVCIDDMRWPEDGGDTLERGRIYTIRKIEPKVRFMGTDGNGYIVTTAVWVDEARRHRDAATGVDPKDVPWGLSRFRPVRKTDISVFTEMQTPTKVTEDA